MDTPDTDPRVPAVTRTLRAWSAPDAAQAALRDAYVAHLAAHPDALRREGPPEHLTASCIVLSHDLSRVCLVLHGKASRWFAPGGHIEPGDADLRSAAAREAAEETGLAGLAVSAGPVDLDRHALGTRFGRCAEHLDVRYAARAPEGAEPVCSPESHAVAWWPVDALPTDEAGVWRETAAAVAALSAGTELLASGRSSASSPAPSAGAISAGSSGSPASSPAWNPAAAGHAADVAAPGAGSGAGR